MIAADSDLILSIWREQMRDQASTNTELDTSLILPIVLGTLDGKPYIMVLSEGKPREIASMQAISVSLNDRRPSVVGENWALIFTLEDWSLRHAFAELCATFATRIREAKTQGTALEQIYASMNQWKRLLQPLPAEQTEQLLLGVAAELIAALVISKENDIPLDTVVDCWTGPLGAPQDFTFPSQEAAWEVKALHLHTSAIAISSPEQLNTAQYPIKLITVELERNTEENDKGITVRDLVQRICLLSNDPESVRTKLEDGIFHAGLRIYSKAIQETRFIPHNVSVYTVDGQFPRIESSKLPAGITSLTYSIQREAIEPYRILAEDNPLTIME